MTLSIPASVADMTHGRTDAPILEVRNLRVVSPSGGAIIDDIGFSVGAGEALAIVGESGAGKSLTALAVMRLLPSNFATVQGGAIELEGTELLSLSGREMRRMRGTRLSMIFQDPLTALNPVLTVGQQIMETLHAHSHVSRAQARSVAIDLLERVGIPAPSARLNEYPHRLSGGMRQRVMIAIALACKPRLLIADEPTTALDVTIQAQILDLLDELRRDLGIGLILITHDLGVVRRVADRIAVMYSGRIVEEGTVGEVLGDPAHPYTAGLLAARAHGNFSATRHRLTEIPGTVPSPESRPPGCAFQNRCTYVGADCADIVPVLRPASPASVVACHHALRNY